MPAVPDNGPYGAEAPLRAGDVLYGFCNGKFGRDSYGDKRVEAIGSDWVVAREVDGRGVWLYEGRPEDLCQYRVRKCGGCGASLYRQQGPCLACGMPQ